MPIRHLYTVTCHYVITPVGGHASFIDTFSNIEFQGLPSKLLFYVVVGFTGDLGDEFVISVEGPDGKVLQELHRGIVERDVGLAEHAKHNRVVHGVFSQPMMHFEFRKKGIYSITLRSGKKLIHRYPLGVTVKPGEKGDADSQ